MAIQRVYFALHHAVTGVTAARRILDLQLLLKRAPGSARAFALNADGNVNESDHPHAQIFVKAWSSAE